MCFAPLLQSQRGCLHGTASASAGPPRQSRALSRQPHLVPLEARFPIRLPARPCTLALPRTLTLPCTLPPAGPKGGYRFFSGRDASRSYVTGK